jgi:hypothetical protein
MDVGVKAMKNPSNLLLALLVSLVFSACGRKESPPPVSSQAGSPITSDSPAPKPDAAMPEDLPPCPGFAAAEDSKGDSQTGSAILLSSLAADALLDSYTADLLADGWVMESSVRQGNEHHLQFRQGDRFLRFQIGPSDNPAGISRLHLAWGQVSGSGGVREASEPEPEEEGPSDVNAGSREW